jgi:hypothetical protein
VQLHPGHVSSNSTPSGAQSRRLAALRRTFIKLLRLTGRPTLPQMEALDHAVRLTWLAEKAALDPDARLDHVVRVSNAAARAKLRLRDLATERKPLSLRDYLAVKAGDS